MTNTLPSMPETINYWTVGCLFGGSLAAYHLYYRFSKLCFKPSFLSKFSTSKPIIQEYHSRVLALTTACLCTITVLVCQGPIIVENFTNLSDAFNNAMRPWDKFIFFSLFGYIVHDIFWCLTHNWHDVLNYAHHLVTSWFCIAMILKNNTATEACIGIVLAEASNVFLHLRWFVKFFMGRSVVLVDLMFAFAFFATRIVGGSWITYWLLITDGPWSVRIMCYTLDALNIGFSLQIFGMMRRTISKWKREREAVKNE